MRRPSFLETRSMSAGRSSRPTLSLRMPRPTPVGARYSPKPRRSTAPHSPVVTPALAQAIEGGMMLWPAPAARARASRAGGARGLGAGHWGRHDVVAGAGGGGEVFERPRARLGFARRAPRLEPLDLL